MSAVHLSQGLWLDNSQTVQLLAKSRILLEGLFLELKLHANGMYSGFGIRTWEVGIYEGVLIYDRWCQF